MENLDFYDQDPDFLNIRLAFLEAVEDFHRERDFTNNFFAIADELKISVENLNSENLSEDGQAFTLPSGKRIIRLRESISPRRKEFTAWHELSHHLFRILRDEEFKAYLDNLLYGHPDWSSSCEEELCFEAAALLLMPTHIVDETLDKTRFSPISIFELSKRTGASHSAAMRRIVRRKGTDCHSILMQADGQVLDSFEYGEKRGRYPIGANFKVEREHPLLTKPFQPLEVEKFSAPVPFKGGNRNWKSKCIAAIDQDSRRIAAFFIDDYPNESEGQLPLF